MPRREEEEREREASVGDALKVNRIIREPRNNSGDSTTMERSIKAAL